jgi:hypothetical protein
MKSHLVPDCIPRLPINRSGVTPTILGVKVLPSTPNVWLAGLQAGLLNSHDYIFVGARADERGDDRDDVRFTFCHRKSVTGTSHPNFTARFNDLYHAFVDFTESNIWMTEAYLNRYLKEDGAAGKGSVLMLCCAGRRSVINPDGSEVMIYSARDELGRGCGPKISLLDTAGELTLTGKKLCYSSIR